MAEVKNTASLSSSSKAGLPRKLTAVGTVGEQNQLFTVYEKNWNCPDCGQENYPARPRCFRCKKAKPVDVNNIVMDPAYEALQAGKTIAWQEVVDPSSFQIYYYNKETGVTQWERPLEMGAAPLATGWFGRGQAGSNAPQVYAAQNAKFLSRPARKQKDFVDPKKYHTEGNNEYNLWYGRFLGDMNDKADREPASDRCVLERDAGYTKADQSTQKGRKCFCIYFAHGQCAKGADCIFYHRIPMPEDDRQTEEMSDCFGRARHSKHKDDMSGVGSFMRPCRTLFVGNLLKNAYNTPKDLEDALWKHFSEWGELESLNVIHRLSIAFPRYRLRTSAEFAKEAMSNQALDHNEVLSIRWAHDDPNPVAKQSIEMADKDAVLALLQAKGVSVTPAAFEYPPEYALPAPKRLRTEDGEEALEEYPELNYPDTDAQYAAAAAAGAGQAPLNLSAEEAEKVAQMSPAEYAAYCERYYAQQSALSRLGLSGDGASATEGITGKKRALDEGSSSSAAAAQSASSNADDWQMYKDEATGAMYYFNSATGESTWTTPAALVGKK